MEKGLPSSFTRIFFSSQSFLQLLSWATRLFRESRTPVVIIDGNHGRLNYTSTTDVYVHTGVITNFSANSPDGKHVKFKRRLIKRILKP
jgi:hypothetical protein